MMEVIAVQIVRKNIMKIMIMIDVLVVINLKDQKMRKKTAAVFINSNCYFLKNLEFCVVNCGNIFTWKIIMHVLEKDVIP
jgi:hypothetical protein